MPVSECGFFRGRRLSAGSENAGHAADARKPRQGAQDDSAGRTAEERSGAGRGRAAGEIVEARNPAQTVGWAFFMPTVEHGNADGGHEECPPCAIQTRYAGCSYSAATFCESSIVAGSSGLSLCIQRVSALEKLSR